MKAQSVKKARVYGASVLLAETTEELLLALENTGPHFDEGEVIEMSDLEEKALEECLKAA